MTVVTGARRAARFATRRALWIDLGEEPAAAPLDPRTLQHFETLDLFYRSLCALLFNYVPSSGHPGGSISSGRFVASLLFDAMDYDFSNPQRRDQDLICYGAGHKALGLYSMWALRNEVARIGAPELLPEERDQLRLEDLLGFRRNPNHATPLFQRLRARPLDGHPTPATPFVPVATGASGVGLCAAIGLAWAAADVFGAAAPRVHIVEGEGGLTPGRVAEALAAAGTAGLGNTVLHVDWNQASIDSNRVCPEDPQPGEYVSWTPMELAYLHDWNVIFVPDGFDLQMIVTAQRLAMSVDNGQPTAIVYRTLKGWRYGKEGKASHGAGHPLCSEGFFRAVAPLVDESLAGFPRCHGPQRCDAGSNAAVLESCYWEALQTVRQALEYREPLVQALAGRLTAARARLEGRARRMRADAPQVEKAYVSAAEREPATPGAPPAGLHLTPGTRTTLRDELGRALNHYNVETGGAFLTAAADLLGSTSVVKVGEGFSPGFWHRESNPRSRLLSIGGICEDAICGILSGISSFGSHIGVASSYGAFLAPLGHVAARLHAIGNDARFRADGEPYRPMVLVCAHAGLKTGEDGPTHADPQALQLVQGNFPGGTLVTLTPWDPQEVPWLVAAALAARPALIVPFVTRPAEPVLDRAALGLAPAALARHGVYRLYAASRPCGSVVLQGSAVTYEFVLGALPLLQEAGLEVDAYVVSSAELFDRLPEAERQRIFPERLGLTAMGITDFTLPTMDRWIRSDRGRAHTLHPFRGGHFLGSGSGPAVLAEAGLDGAGQFRAICRYLSEVR